MKNLSLFSKFLVGGFFLAAITLTLSMKTWAEDEPQDKISKLESQVKELMDFKEKTQTEKPGFQTIEDFKNIDPQPQQSGGDGTNFPPSMLCTNDHLEWPSSNVYKDSEWAMEDHFMPSNTFFTQYTDLNGDGLTDYFLLSSVGGDRLSCVHLNNGRGWDLVHKCFAKQGWTFYGDCAKTE